MKDILIEDRYRVDEKIGEGGFGLVYAGTDLRSEQKVAIKLLRVRDDDFRLLRNEAETYAGLAGGTGIPRLDWYGEECDYYVLIHELLGPSLEDLFNYCGRRFSLKAVLLLADQALSRMEYIHSRGFLHRDVKPENFLMGLGMQGDILYTVDFGLAEDIGERRRDKPLEGRPFIGTHRYASINAHNGQEQSWRDDLESLGYVLLYCLRGSLPWQGLKAVNKSEKYQRVKERKTTLPTKTLCQGCPSEFASYMDYVRALRFNERPQYAQLRQLFQRLFIACGFEHDSVYDWTVKLFYEAQQEA